LAVVPATALPIIMSGQTATPASSKPVQPYADYLSPAPETAKASSTAAAAAKAGRQLRADVESRYDVEPGSCAVGEPGSKAWTCVPEGVALDAVRQKGQQATPNAQRTAIAAATTRTGTCKVEGCWHTYSATKSDFYGAISYGWGDKNLGTVEVYFEINSSGAELRSKPFWFESTRRLKDLVFEGDRLYLSTKFPGGNSIKDTWAQYDPPTYRRTSARTGCRTATRATRRPQPGRCMHTNSRGGIPRTRAVGSST
jgi:hypothetical protein